VKFASLIAAAAPLVVAAATPWQQQALSAAGPFIDKANSDWAGAIVKGDADLLASPYDEHAIFVGRDGSVSIGKVAVRAMYASRRPSSKIVRASIRSDGRAAHDPNDVYEWGTATMIVRSADGTKQTSSRYLTVWHHKQERWLITHNIAF